MSIYTIYGMAQKKKTKTRYLEVSVKKNSFTSRLVKDSKSCNLSVKNLRSLLSDEKAKILYVLKTSEPKSIYALSKMLKRDFKSVRGDVGLLEKFGLISLKATKIGKKKILAPSLTTDKLQVTVNF